MYDEDTRVVKNLIREMLQSLKCIPLQLKTGEPSENIRTFWRSMEEKATRKCKQLIY